MVQCRHMTANHRSLSASDAMLLISPNLVGSHAGLAENSDVARSVIPDDHIELLRCDGERHSALLLHARTNVSPSRYLDGTGSRDRPCRCWNDQSSREVRLRRSRLLAPARLPSGYGHLLMAILTM